jgi:hypothetical protein
LFKFYHLLGSRLYQLNNLTLRKPKTTKGCRIKEEEEEEEIILDYGDMQESRLGAFSPISKAISW